MMQKKPDRQFALAQIGKAASGVLTLAALAVLVGCQGLSQSGSGSVQQIGTLVLASASLDFGSVSPNTSKSLTLAVTNAGNKTVTISGATVSTKLFALASPTLPVSLGAGLTTNLTITFNPTAAGAVSATLTFTSDGQPSTTTETLTGTGVVASHSVSLSWTASTSQNISGYNVYRSSYASSSGSCGSFARINGVLDTSTLYTDSAVTNGSAYCYATTAVDTSNVESGYSNIVSNLQIPAQ